MKNYFLFSLAFLFLFSCGPAKEENKEEEPSEVAAEMTIFERGLLAHGSLEAWNSFGTLKFRQLTPEDSTEYLVDLKNRFERVHNEGKFTVGFTTDSIYIQPNPDSFGGDNPRFYQNLMFYFFSMPFVTADPGANQEELEPAQINGVTYNRVKITFGDGVGIAPKDQYILWFDPSTDLLAMINYSVTYFDESRAEKYSAIRYTKWQEVNGLKVPEEIVGHRWAADTLGEERYKRIFDQVSLSVDRPEPKVFELAE